MPKKVLVIGGKGNGTVLGEMIVDANRRGDKEYAFAGFVNDRDNVSEIDGYPVLGGLDDVSRLLDEGYHFIYSLYKFDDQNKRIELFEELHIPHNRLVTFIHPTAYVAPSCKLSPGVFVCANVSITSSNKIGLNCIIRPGTTIGHDNVIEDHVSISAGASVGSHVRLGKGVMIGLKACIREYLELEAYSMLGMGSVLTKKMKYGELWFGNPGRRIRKAKWLKNND